MSAFFVLLLALWSYCYGWLWCVTRPPSGQKQTKTSYFKINPYYVKCFVGFLRYQKRQKQRYILLLGVVWLPGVALHLARWWCPLGAGAAGSLCYFADVSKIGEDSAGCSAFCLLYRFVFGALYLNMALFRVFRGF